MNLPLEPKLNKDSAKFLESTDRKTKEAIKAHILQLVSDPFSFPLSKPLKRRTERCCRVGSYRILFTVEEEQNVLLVVKIGHRKDVYDE
jgi:mRNA interferase RelE/StbE